MEEAIMQMAVNCVKVGLKPCIGKLISFFKDKFELGKFQKSLEEWIEAFVCENEVSILANSAFSNYLEHYNLLEHIFFYITDTDSSALPERQFITEEIQKFEVYLKRQVCTVTSNDHSVISDFVSSLFQQVKEFYENKLPAEQQSLMYEIKQLRKQSRLEPESHRVLSDKLVYNPILNMIERKAVPFRYLQESSVYFHMDEVADLYEICRIEQYVVLLGDAGCGKTTALKQIAHRACADYHTLLISLADYSGEKIEDLICQRYPDYAQLSLFLIFDAFDEIGDENRSAFARKLNTFVSNHANAIVLISTRSNFYKFTNDAGSGATFTKFKEYGLCPLRGNDIKNYLEQNSIDVSDFNRNLYQKGLHELAYNPFYLVRLVELMREHSCLPEKRNFMDEIIKVSFQLDADKFTNPDVVYDREYELRTLLRKAAFVMQCKEDKVHIERSDFQRIFSDKNERDLLTYSSLFLKNSNEQWQFEHNNFREYLAAEFLSTLSVERMKEVLCYDEERVKIRESWVNVISYLVLIYEDSDLYEWMKDVSDSLLVRFETTRVDSDERSNIFIRIFNSYAEKNMWITHNENSVEELVNFGQSEKTLDFLLNEIRSPQNHWALSNALHLLKRFKGLYAKDDIVREVLYHCVQSCETRDYEIGTAIRVVSQLGLQTPEITDTLILMLTPQRHESIHEGIVHYLIQSEAEEYIDVLLQELEYSHNLRKNHEISIQWEVKEVLLNLQGKSAVQRAFAYLCSKQFHFSGEKEVLNYLIEKLIQFYQLGDDEIFDAFVDELLLSEEHFYLIFTNDCKRFFQETDTVLRAFEKAVVFYIERQGKNDDIFYFLSSLYNAACVEKLLDYYEEEPEKYGQLMLSFTCNLSKGSEFLSQCTEALKRNGVPVPPPRAEIDFDKNRRQGQQIYFNALFEREKYQELVGKLVELLGDSEITCGKVKEKFYGLHNYGTLEHETLLPLVWEIDGCRLEDKMVRNFTSYVGNWRDFAISNICGKLSKEITITDQQKIFIQEYCSEVKDKIDFVTEVEDSDEGGITYTLQLIQFCAFTHFFDFNYEKEIIRRLTVVPKYLWSTGEPEEQIFSQYVINHLTHDELCECVRYNIVNLALCSWSKREHIEFCKKYHMSDAMQLAEQICRDVKVDSYDKRVALEYIDAIKDDANHGYQYIYSQFLATEDEKLLEALVHVTMHQKSHLLTERLEEENEKSENKRFYLLQLIRLQSEYGLCRYYEIASAQMKIPDYSEHNYTELTDAISGIDRLELLPLLVELQELLFTDGFVDQSDFGLRSSLSKAMINIAKEHHSEVLQKLNKVLKKEQLDPREKSFCNYLISNIEDNRKLQEDTAWSLSRIECFLREMKH